MIPKVIHYSWFGPKPIPEISKKALKSWEKHCPDYKIVHWNESNFKYNDNDYLNKTYRLGLFSKFNNYARLKIINEYGGIYLDIDVELIKPLDDLLANKAFVGFESETNINTGNGFGSIKNNPIIYDILREYDKFSNLITSSKSFKENSPTFESRVFEKHGLLRNNTVQKVGYFLVLNSDYLCPKKELDKNYLITSDTYSIHHRIGSWISTTLRVKIFLYRILEKIIGKKLLNKLTNTSKI
jgi:mannosyltransferase OCH1-like enzyme